MKFRKLNSSIVIFFLDSRPKQIGNIVGGRFLSIANNKSNGYCQLARSPLIYDTVVLGHYWILSKDVEKWNGVGCQVDVPFYGTKKLPRHLVHGLKSLILFRSNF